MNAPSTRQVAPMRHAYRHDVSWNLQEIGRWIIAKFTGIPVHTETLFGDMAYGADFSGYRAIPVRDLFAYGRWEIIDAPVDGDGAATAEAMAKSLVGKGYDWLGAAFAWFIGRPAGNAARERYFCSEASAKLDEAAGLELARKRHAWHTPRRHRDLTRKRWANPADVTEWVN